MGLLPLRAAIAGGSLLQVASISPLTLDASGSRDLDVAPTLDQVTANPPHLVHLKAFPAGATQCANHISIHLAREGKYAR